MRRAIAVIGVSVVGLMGCRADKDALGDDLKADLAASASSIELAGQADRAQSLQVVSALEQGRNAEPVERTRTPRRVAAQSADLTQQDKTSPAPEVRQETMVAEVQSEAPQAPQPAPEVSSVPMVAPRPASLPVEVPADGGGRGLGSGGIGTGDAGAGIGIGDMIGVVIRGGGVGPDHCPPPRRRPRGRILR